MSFRSRWRETLRAIGLVHLLLGSASPARAQIFSWHDADGNLVLSNRRPSGAIETYAVLRTDGVRATRDAATDRASTYDRLIVEHARLNGVPIGLVRAVVQVESGFNAHARSPKGALGLMQLMPATIQQFRVLDPFDPADNVRAGVAYLRELLDRYDGNQVLALAAYNAGPQAVDKHNQSVPPFRETRDYVSRVNRLAARTPPGDSAQKTGHEIYKTTELVDGRSVPRYSDQKPSSGPYNIIAR